MIVIKKGGSKNKPKLQLYLAKNWGFSGPDIINYFYML
jgi:hypothetical protein